MLSKRELENYHTNFDQVAQRVLSRFLMVVYTMLSSAIVLSIAGGLFFIIRHYWHILLYVVVVLAVLAVGALAGVIIAHFLENKNEKRIRIRR